VIVSYDIIMFMKPPYSITSKALNLSVDIATILGYLEGVQSHAPQAELRKTNRIKTIQGSLSIEPKKISSPYQQSILTFKFSNS